MEVLPPVGNGGFTGRRSSRDRRCRGWTPRSWSPLDTEGKNHYAPGWV